MGEDILRPGGKRGGWRKGHMERKEWEVRAERLLSWDTGKAGSSKGGRKASWKMEGPAPQPGPATDPPRDFSGRCTGAPKY